MALISFKDVSKYYGSEIILDHVSFDVFKNDRIALIGDNGAGKSTILKIILKEIEPTLIPKEGKAGEINILGNLNIGYLDQNAITNLNQTVKEELESAFKEDILLEKEFNKISEEFSNNLSDEIILNKYNVLLKKIEDSRFYTYKNDIETMISKFSFPLSILDKNIKELSGGEKMKIAFIKILLSKNDLLLLDEPTNHLDISTIEWLEKYLKEYKGTILFISHDKYFIEALANKVYELDNHKLSIYNTTYLDYLKEKEARYNYLLKERKKEDKELEHMKKFIEYYRYKPRFVGRVKDRMKKVEKLEKHLTQVPTSENKEINFKFEGGNLKNKELLEVENLVVGYQNKAILKPISFSLYGKDRLALVGDNGIGKTTLVKTLIKEIPQIEGKIKEKRILKYGYIKQNDYSFDKSMTIIEYLRNRYPTMLDKDLRTALGTFLFIKEDVFKNVLSLSNGEKMRVFLCCLMLSSYDVLILDEPTNHLDMVTKECLIKALKKYQGAIIFISHDRYFINELAEYVLYLSKDKNIFIEGNYDNLKYILSQDIKELTIEEIEEDLKKTFKKEKLSNNKINEYKARLKEIEEDLETIDTLLEGDFEDYKKIEELQENKENLEKEYLDILKILEE